MKDVVRYIVEMMFWLFFFIFVIPIACDHKPVCITVDKEQHCISIGSKVE
jgi:hypothetical protein